MQRFLPAWLTQRAPTINKNMISIEIFNLDGVRKIRVRNSGAGNGCANFMDTWKKCVLSAGKTMSVKFLLFRVFFLAGGGEVPILFLWARGFF